MKRTGVNARAGNRGRFRRDRRGVSPVVGTILVLFIVLVAMAGILGWGVPAIQGMQAHAEFQSVMTQLVQVDQEIRVLRDPQNTRLAQVSMNQGSLRVVDGSTWVVTVAMDGAHTGVHLQGWEGNDPLPDLEIRDLPGGTHTVTVDRVQGGTFTTRANQVCDGACTIAIPYPLAGNVTRVQVRDGGDLKTESWIFDTKRLSYHMSQTDTTNRIHLEMGAVIAQQGQALFLEEASTVKEPVLNVVPPDTSYLFRAIQFEGDTGASGKGRHSILANMIDNYGITRGRPSLADAQSVRIQIDDGGAPATRGLLEEGFCHQFLRRAHYTGDCTGADVNVVYEPPDPFFFEFTQSVVRLTVRPF